MMNSDKSFRAGILVCLVLALLVPPGEVQAAEDIDYVEVRDEPQHRHLFENEHVRAYDVLLPVGYVTLYHRHSENTTYTVVQPTSLKSQSVGGSPATSRLRRGAVFFNPQREHPVTHQVTNVGESVGRLIGVELKGNGRIIEEPPIAAYGYTPILSNRFVRASKLTLDPGESTGMHTFRFPTVTVALTDGLLTRETADGHSTTETIEAAQAVYGEKEITHSIQNVGHGLVEFVIYEILSE